MSKIQHATDYKTMKTLTIKSLGHGWYDFSTIPQGHRYIKVHTLNCSTDRKAKNRAKKINPAYEYEIEKG